MRWFCAIAVFLGGLAIVLAVVGASYQVVTARADARRFPEPGRRVEIGGYSLKLNCAGAGSPTVILESGFGDVLPEWESVQQGIAKFSRVCSYDRAGYGGSDAGPMPRTSAQIARELHSLLRNAGEKPPFLPVGYSFGGYNVRVFNGFYPDEVEGLVLVDAVQEDEYAVLPSVWNRIGEQLREHCESQARMAPLLVDLGIGRLILRARGQDQGSYLILESKYLRARASEIENMRTSAEQARAAGSLGNKPLIVLTAGKEPPTSPDLSQQDAQDYQRIWAGDLQMRLAHLSSRGIREMVEGSDHGDIALDRPDAIVNAVKEVRAAALSTN
jgi:pimeloyl-ACP methyl ester carboxylesterase